LVAACTRIERGVGIDVGLRWLVLARKRLEEAGVERPLVCASVEALPFGDGVVDRVAGESILENAADPSAALAEAARVLPPGGRLWLTTPNKYSLGPDPHIGLPASGWLPEILVQLYIRRAGIIPPKRQLFGVGELRRALSRAGFARPSVQIPRIADAQRVGLPGVVNRVVDGYHLARAMPGVRSALRAIAPTLVVAATRRPA
jgi:ubiquinone/menaquinone biosynthesis C-methylase UbiE